LNLWSTRALFVRTTAGAIGIRLSLRPFLLARRAKLLQTSGASRRENTNAYPLAVKAFSSEVDTGSREEFGFREPGRYPSPYLLCGDAIQNLLYYEPAQSVLI
jgi:hypothetical protein